VSPVCNCPAVRQRQPALQSARSRHQSCGPNASWQLMEPSGQIRREAHWPHPLQACAMKISSEASAVSWPME
jgi:hypothetical protein